MHAVLRRIVDGNDGETFSDLCHLSVGVVPELVDVLRLRDDDFRLGSIQLLENFGRSVEGVGGGGDGSDHGSSEKGEREFGAVLEEDHDDVSLFEAEVGEPSSDFARNEVGFCKGVGFVGGSDDQAWTIGELGVVFKAVGVEREVVGDGNFREF